MLFHGVLISCEDKEKRKVIRQAIVMATQAGFDLSGLKIVVSPKYDRELSSEFFGACTPENKRIVLRSDVNWRSLAAQTMQMYPVWAQNTYAGSSVHLVLHEIGHYLHYQNCGPAYSVAFHPYASKVQARLAEELGHPYPATCAGEMIPDMIAGKIGAQKQFSPYCETFYRNYGGPAVPAEPRGTTSPFTVSWTI